MERLAVNKCPICKKDIILLRLDGAIFAIDKAQYVGAVQIGEKCEVVSVFVRHSDVCSGVRDGENKG